jgi:hypothetical protein
VQVRATDRHVIADVPEAEVPAASPTFHMPMNVFTE